METLGWNTTMLHEASVTVPMPQCTWEVALLNVQTFAQLPTRRIRIQSNLCYNCGHGAEIAAAGSAGKSPNDSRAGLATPPNHLVSEVQKCAPPSAAQALLSSHLYNPLFHWHLYSSVNIFKYMIYKGHSATSPGKHACAPAVASPIVYKIWGPVAAADLDGGHDCA